MALKGEPCMLTWMGNLADELHNLRHSLYLDWCDVHAACHTKFWKERQDGNMWADDAKSSPHVQEIMTDLGIAVLQADKIITQQGSTGNFCAAEFAGAIAGIGHGGPRPMKQLPHTENYAKAYPNPATLAALIVALPERSHAETKVGDLFANDLENQQRLKDAVEILKKKEPFSKF